jgi:hypothetical protein
VEDPKILQETGMKILHKNCDRSLAKEKTLPRNSYLVRYNDDNGEEKYDIVQSNSRVEIFDYYYDTYGKDGIKFISWTEGTVNPKLYGEKKQEDKKRNKK